MIDQTQKLEKFKQAIFNEVESSANELIENTKQECEQRISDARAEAALIRENGFAGIDSEYTGLAARTASAQKLESRRNILLKREEIIDRVFDNVKKELQRFCQSSEYEKLMIRRLRKCAETYPHKQGEVLISPKDKGLADKLGAVGDYTVKVSSGIELGGFTLVFAQDNLAIDCTFDEQFSKQRRGFAAVSGMKL